jgi:hypothetical protein
VFSEFIEGVCVLSKSVISDRYRPPQSIFLLDPLNTSRLPQHHLRCSEDSFTISFSIGITPAHILEKQRLTHQVSSYLIFPESNTTMTRTSLRNQISVFIFQVDICAATELRREQNERRSQNIDRYPIAQIRIL